MSEAADGLLGEMRALRNRRGGQCDLCRLLRDMAPEHVEAVKAGMQAHDITDDAVATWIAQKGYVWENKDPRSTVRHHRQMRHE